MILKYLSHWISELHTPWPMQLFENCRGPSAVSKIKIAHEIGGNGANETLEQVGGVWTKWEKHKE